MKRIFINGMVVTMNKNRDVFQNGYVVTEGSRIMETGPMERLDLKRLGLTEPLNWKDKVRESAPGECLFGAEFRREARVVNMGRGVLMPGLVNTHCHMGMIPFRGLGDDCKDRLRRFLLPMESRAMDRELAALSSRHAVCEMLLSGTTTVMDMYYFEDAVAEVMDKAGIRGIAGETVMEDATCDAAVPAEAERLGIELMERYKNHPRISGCLAPHGTTTCNSETLKRVYDLDCKYEGLYTLHVAEMDYEMKYLRDTCQCSPVEYLERLGVLGERSLLAHSIQVSNSDIQLLKSRGSKVAHCIGSNTKAAKGVAPVSRMQEWGVTVGLGTDGPASGNTLDLFTQMKFCANFHKNETKNRSAFPAEEIVAMATIEGAKALGLDGITGSLEAGKEADIILVETESPNMFPIYDPYAALVYSAQGYNVKDVYVAGDCLVRDKKLVYEDMERVRKNLAEKMETTAFGDMKNFV